MATFKSMMIDHISVGRPGGRLVPGSGRGFFRSCYRKLIKLKPAEAKEFFSRLSELWVDCKWKPCQPTGPWLRALPAAERKWLHKLLHKMLDLQEV